MEHLSMNLEVQNFLKKPYMVKSYFNDLHFLDIDKALTSQISINSIDYSTFQMMR